MDALAIVLGLDRKKCVIVDLDGVLWPGVLAETGSPFAWSPEIGGPNSYIGLYFGIHEALRDAAPARHPAGLRQQERRGDGAGAVALQPATTRATGC